MSNDRIRVNITSNQNSVEVTNTENKVIVTDKKQDTNVNVIQNETSVVTIVSKGPKGDRGEKGEQASLSGSVYITGSLEVSSSVTAQSFTGSLFGTASNALTSSFITPTGTNAFVQGGNSFGVTTLLGTNDNQNLQFETSGSVRVHIGNNGNVGIGTTSPTQRLDVRDGFIQVSGSGASGYGYLLNRAGQDTYSIRHLDGGLTINNETDSIKEMTFLGNGNVGINKINPSARLEIRGSGATSATTALRVENSNATASLVVLDDGNVGIGTATPTTLLHISGSDSAQMMRINSPTNANILFVSGSGRVGIGTTTPNSTLDVNGNTIITGSITNTSTITTLGSVVTPTQTIAVGNGFGNSSGTTNLLNIAGNLVPTATAIINSLAITSTVSQSVNPTTIIRGILVSPTFNTLGPQYRGFEWNNNQGFGLYGVGAAPNYLSGSLGIGTTNPLARLHVSGSDGNDFLRITSGSQNILNVRSGSVVWFSGTGVAPTSGFDLDIQGTGTANGGSVRILGNSTVWQFASVSSVNRGGTSNSDMFNVTMGGISPTAIQNPMSITFNANQNPASGSGYTVLRLNATHASTAGTGSKLLQTWEFAGVQRSVVNITGSIGVGITRPSASVHISSSLGLAPILAITPHHPLPTTNIPTGSFMVSASLPPKPFFWDGTTWNALY